jgi:hypothetical protein
LHCDYLYSMSLKFALKCWMLVLFLLYNLVSLLHNCYIECLHHSKYILLFFLVFLYFVVSLQLHFHFPTSISLSIHLNFSMFLFLFWLIMFHVSCFFCFRIVFSMHYWFTLFLGISVNTQLSHLANEDAISFSMVVNNVYVNVKQFFVL